MWEMCACRTAVLPPPLLTATVYGGCAQIAYYGLESSIVLVCTLYSARKRGDWKRFYPVTDAGSTMPAPSTVTVPQATSQKV